MPTEPTNITPDETFRIAAITTTYFENSHADVFVTRWVEPQPHDGDWGWPQPQSRIVSAYIDIIGDDDIGCEILRRNSVPLCDTIEQALIRDDELGVDAVLLIGEHGDYGKNEIGQHRYPRKEMFDKIVAVYRRVGRSVPIFCDKQLSWNFEWATEMMQTAAEMNFLLIAGSSVPYTRPVSPFPLPSVPNDELDIVVVFFGPDESYGFHSLEYIQQLVENRPGGETGVRNVTAWRGDEVWRQHDAGTWSQELMSAAIAEADVAPPLPIPNRGPDVRANCAAANEGGPLAFQMIYNDGMRVTHINLEGHARNWAAATCLEDGAISVTSPILDGEKFFHGHFASFASVIEQSFRSGQPQYPTKRTLLTSGQIAAAMRARAQPGKMLSTPELSIQYSGKNRMGWREDVTFGVL
jgi:hypothetical protein